MADDATQMPDHAVIWLSPTCARCQRDGFGERTWCQDAVNGCDECGQPPVKFIRSEGSDRPTVTGAGAEDQGR